MNIHRHIHKHSQLPACAFAIAFALALCLAGPVQSRADAGDTMQGAYTAMQSFEATFTQTLTHQESGSEEVREGSLVFQKPLLARWETFEPWAELLLVTDKEIWNYLPEEEIAYKYSLELAQDSRSVLMVITGQAPLKKDFDVEYLSDEAGLARILLYPKEPVANLVEARLWVAKDTGYIKKAELLDFYGNTNAIEFKTFTPDAKVKKDVFAFTPPAGVQVEDHTDGTVPAKKQLFQ